MTIPFQQYKEEGHRINHRIESRDVRLIGAAGENLGVVPTYQALAMAEEANLDLVEVSPPFDHGDITAILASNIVFEYLSLLAIKNC